MKKLLTALLLAISLTATANEYVDLTVKQTLVVAEAATALVTGPILLPAAMITGRGAELCSLLEPKYTKPNAQGAIFRPKTSYDPNSDGRDQCPKGNWLRVLPYLGDLVND